MDGQLVTVSVGARIHKRRYCASNGSQLMIYMGSDGMKYKCVQYEGLPHSNQHNKP